jgi:hypothetical protein
MMNRMGGFGSKRTKKGRKGKKKGPGGGRVTQGRSPLRLPDLDLEGLAGSPAGGTSGLPDLRELGGPGGRV